MEISILNTQGKETGRKVTLSDAVFNLENPSEHAIYLDVKHFLANQRQGTHKAKERGEVRGSTKKPWKQKGTGGARAGHKRSPLWRHGGRVFGPRPRDYSISLNKKVKLLARQSALTLKARDNKITVVENFSFDKPRTKDFIAVLKNLKLEGSKVLVLTNGLNDTVYRSGRNLPYASILPVAHVNTYSILNAESVILLEGAVETINNQTGK